VILSSRPLAFSLSALLVGLVALGCSRDYGLGITSSSSSAAGGAGGVGGAGGAGGAGGEGGMGGEGGSEPVGPTRLTIVNGVNDYDAIRICFMPYPGGDPAVMPWPSASSGLGFAKSAVIDAIEAVVPASGDVQPVVIAGDLAKTVGKSCDELIAAGGMGAGGGGGAGGSGGAAPFVVSALPVLPGSVFSAQKSLLLVPMGCLGGAGHEDPSAPLACGQGYSPATPTAGLVALSMSRITREGHVSLQVVNASAALSPSDVRLLPGFDGATEWFVAKGVSTGAIAPIPPFAELPLAGLGSLDAATIKTYPANQGTATGAVTLSQVFANGGLSKGDVAEGKGYVLVAVGGYPGLAPGAFWHSFTFVMVRSDP